MKSNNTNMKENILLSATELITKNGVKNTSLSDIAKAVNISKGTLYYHYSSKDALISEIANTHLNAISESILQCIQGMDPNNPKEQMINLIMEKISDIEDRGRIHMYILCEAITGNDPLKEQIKLKYIEWRNTLKSEIVKISSKDAEALSFLLVSIVDGLVLQGLLKTENLPFENIADFLVTNWY
ncbi:TetR/AcrR family transcriptional regulator [Paraclostridium bifermentans]|jgi:AcrR family transcriptional regulator|uniref:Bacterial regulatory s, tetR family protein n=3 Tax=Paraclostridium bifermentans TaxID=1490 RepID=T4VLY3_PARBF|nr:TetR/AcrR family transcriptional regulator [Paraclostridium bifermentans]EQK42518.1 bacterial regulatory s, tetR family protein [[Clostridium] bifermentans ATCC 638] [Paraclostridium bifermentans ATCC 638 = DSM 14991]MBS5952616.1 TetR/AcrR family transcriptional regulator [Paraclostridium bifermentans]MBU5287937.1 TetR/AcrR family transcriptional regulator [Paraclostridium bifermentans]MDU3334992.1 TetR/AcrR family transcriptional regulator [Paraclostridium bifermentans]OSB11895.1 TetR fami